MTYAEKFLTERIIQRCDYEESISKTHRTINGYIQLKELIQLCELSFKRIRTARTLGSILEEAKSKYVKQNIVHDKVIGLYFSDLKDYIQKYDVSKVSNGNSRKELTEIGVLAHDLKVFESQLDKYYYPSLIKEITSIDYSDAGPPARTLKNISDFSDLLISYLLYKDYSISSLNEVLRRWVENRYRITIKRFISFFNSNTKEYKFIIRIGKKTEETTDFISLIQKRSENIRLLKGEDISELLLKEKFVKTDLILEYKAFTTDPNLHIRTQYDILLKKLVIGKDRQTLSPFTNYFKDNYWQRIGSRYKNFHNASINGDPISVPARKNTLRKSLSNDEEIKLDYRKDLEYPSNPVLQKSVYYYHLALGSKSIENSLSLLWTSLEILLPYRIFSSDIENVKHFLGKIISIGAFARDFHNLIERIVSLNAQNSNCLISLGIGNLKDRKTEEGIKQWYTWITEKTNVDEKFLTLKNCSELLAYEFTSFVKPLLEGKLEHLNNRVMQSKYSVEFQIQRIYLHRNQIVHSGDLISEYSNLWKHLEWYVGKILYQSLKKIEFHTNPMMTIDKVFRDLESEYDYITSYMGKNKNKNPVETERIMISLLELSWQAN